MDLGDLKIDCAKKQKKGLHIILSSVLIWIAILLVHLSDLPILKKNLLTFCCTAPLLPISYFISKIIKVDFQNKDNPLSKLGLLFSINQLLYLLIAMWIFAAVPDKMLMVMVMIFGAHLMPYSWLYQSNTYMVLSIMVPILGLIVGLYFEPFVLAIIMVVIELIFSMLLVIENRKMA